MEILSLEKHIFCKVKSFSDETIHYYTCNKDIKVKTNEKMNLLFVS